MGQNSTDLLLAGKKDKRNLSRMSSKFDQIIPLTLNSIFSVVATPTALFFFYLVFFILCSNKDNHNISVEFAFRPDLASHC